MYEKEMRPQRGMCWKQKGKSGKNVNGASLLPDLTDWRSADQGWKYTMDETQCSMISAQLFAGQGCYIPIMP